MDLWSAEKPSDPDQGTKREVEIREDAGDVLVRRVAPPDASAVRGELPPLYLPGIVLSVGFLLLPICSPECFVLVLCF